MRPPTTAAPTAITAKATTIALSPITAIRIDPKYATAYYNRGSSYVRKGDHDRAIADLSEAIRIDPKYRVAYNDRGNSYSSKGNYDPAIADFTEAIRIDPKYATAYYN